MQRRLATPAVSRRIVAFEQDEVGDWVAVLDCGHRQHVRHQPPWQERPWVTAAAGRAEHIGHVLPCRLCADGTAPQH